MRFSVFNKELLTYLLTLPAEPLRSPRVLWETCAQFRCKILSGQGLKVKPLMIFALRHIPVCSGTPTKKTWLPAGL